MLATMMPDGSPQLTPVWIDLDGDDVLVNTSEGTVKLANVRRDPRVALTVVDPRDRYRVLSLRGEVVEIAKGSVRHINELSLRYDGFPWQPEPGLGARVTIRIRPRRFTWV
jgi:PPOX class probable F420-dependent enzyme